MERAAATCSALLGLQRRVVPAPVQAKYGVIQIRYGVRCVPPPAKGRGTGLEKTDQEL